MVKSLKISKLLLFNFYISIILLAITMFLPSNRNTTHRVYMGFTLISGIIAVLAMQKRFLVLRNNFSYVTLFSFLTIGVVIVYTLVGTSNIPSLVSIRTITAWFNPYFVYLQYPLHIFIGFVIVRTGRFSSAYKAFRISCYLVLVVWILGSFRRVWAPGLSFSAQFHDSFVAFCGIVIALYFISKLANYKVTSAKMFFYIFAIICLFLLPFFGYLRASSVFTSIVSIIVFIGYRKKKIFRYSVPGLFFLLLIYFIFGAKIENAFGTGTYGYRNPIDVLKAASDPNEPNALWRTNAWSESALPIFLASPLVGTVFTNTFDPSNFGATGSGMYHSFWISTLVDGGLLLLVPITLLFLYPLILGLKDCLQYGEQTVVYVGWQLMVIGTISTNVTGTGSIQSGILAMSYGLATAALINIHSRNSRISLNQPSIHNEKAGIPL